MQSFTFATKVDASCFFLQSCLPNQAERNPLHFHFVSNFNTRNKFLVAIHSLNRIKKKRFWSNFASLRFLAESISREKLSSVKTPMKTELTHFPSPLRISMNFLQPLSLLSFTRLLTSKKMILYRQLAKKSSGYRPQSAALFKFEN